ncbi:glycosyltransferase family 2 protein [Exiguobacterium aestuarii]|uniref:glycosyltransferase family 2 protein n=1 Tax=Exiguobacterium aestuarii TaxID=273527 RepID=UPI001CD5511D|nr:glycosyltransferase family 2 protein [Exiguobacterium aestuarii]MCA0981100.1 glycosyltransferase [Exiguobacterium aestuarii]
MFTQKNKISIIVPMYNAEKYLHECIDSILNQEYENIEVIAVDDHSTDNSRLIIEDYQKENSNISLYTTVGKGLGAARNTAIKHATGEYIMFIDSDDEIPKSACTNLIEAMLQNESTDLVIGNMNLYKESGTEPMKEFELLHGVSMDVNSIERFPAIIGSQTACNKLYKKSIIDTFNLKFPEGLWHEDLYFNTIYLSNCERIKIIRDVVYYYRKFDGEQTITSNFSSEQYALDRLKIIEMVLEKLKSKDKKLMLNLFKIYTLKKFLLPFENQIYKKYDETFSEKMFYKINALLEDFEWTDISFAQVKSTEYTLMKIGDLKTYKKFKMAKVLPVNIYDGKFMLNLSNEFHNKMKEEVPSQLKDVSFFSKYIQLHTQIDGFKTETLTGDSVEFIGRAYYRGVNLTESNFSYSLNLKKENEIVREIPLQTFRSGDLHAASEESINNGTFTFRLHNAELMNLNNKEYYLELFTNLNGFIKRKKISIPLPIYKSLIEMYDYPVVLDENEVAKYKKNNIMREVRNISRKTTKFDIVDHDITTYYLKRSEILESNNKDRIMINIRQKELMRNSEFVLETIDGKLLNRQKVIENHPIEILIHNFSITSLSKTRAFIINSDQLKIELDASKLYNHKKITNKFYLLSLLQKVTVKTLLEFKTTPFGWYLVFLKTKGRNKK